MTGISPNPESVKPQEDDLANGGLEVLNMHPNGQLQGQMKALIIFLMPGLLSFHPLGSKRVTGESQLHCGEPGEPSQESSARRAQPGLPLAWSE